jgi:2-keto-4-pentenoate hydratase/2-oxohepta-3-ene-1,7-dioic acid hydratase in catechol pathway
LTPIEDLIAFVSQYFTLKKGDVLFTGTPAGVGPVTPGDRLEGFLNGESRLRVNIR